MGWLCIPLSHLLVSGHVFKQKYSNANVRFKSTLLTSDDVLSDQGIALLSSLTTVFLLHLWNLHSALFQWFVVFASVAPLVLFSLFLHLCPECTRQRKWQSDKILPSIWQNVAILANLYIFYDKVSDSTVLPNDRKSFCDVTFVEDNLEVILPLHDF